MKLQSILALTLATVVGQFSTGGWQPAHSGNCTDGVCQQPRITQVTTPQTPSVMPSPSVVRIEVDDGPMIHNGRPARASFWGTGVIAAADSEYAWVTTAAHNLRGRKTKDVVVHIRGKRPHWARVVLEDKQQDVAVLRIQNPKVPVATMADAEPKDGDMLEIGGWGQGKFRWRRGRVRRMQNTLNMLEIGTPARGGDSGGPVLNSRGHVVGIIVTSDNSTCQAVCIKRIRPLLAKVIPPWRNKHGLPPPAPKLPRKRPLVVIPPAPKIDFDIKARIDALEARIDALEANQEEPGPKGPPGEKGPEGPRGPVGEGGQVDVSKLPPLTIHMLDVEGKVVQEYIAGLGETVRFQLVPLK